MANTFVFSNNAKSALAGAITSSATTANLSPGTGVEFPSPGAGQDFSLTFTDLATGTLNEIVYVTARSGDTVTMVRAQEGTVALNWLAGDIAALLPTAGQLAAMAQLGTTGLDTEIVSVIDAQFTGSEQTLNLPGFQNYPGGFIEKWGSATFSASGTTTAVINETFATPFPSTCFVMVGNALGPGNSTHGGYPSVAFPTGGLSRTGFQAVIDMLGFMPVDQVVVISWRAIGA